MHMIAWLRSLWRRHREVRLIKAWKQIQQDPENPVALVLLNDLSTWYVDCPPDKKSIHWLLSKGGEECEVPSNCILDIQSIQLIVTPPRV